MSQYPFAFAVITVPLISILLLLGVNVYLEDKVLFLGDSTCDDFMTGIKDRELCQKLEAKIKALNPETCMEGHWEPVETEDTLNDLMNS